MELFSPSSLRHGLINRSRLTESPRLARAHPRHKWSAARPMMLLMIWLQMALLFLGAGTALAEAGSCDSGSCSSDIAIELDSSAEELEELVEGIEFLQTQVQVSDVGDPPAIDPTFTTTTAPSSATSPLKSPISTLPKTV